MTPELFEKVYSVQDYVTFTGVAGDVAVVFAVADVAIAAGVGVVLDAVEIIVGPMGLVSFVVAD